MMSISVAFKDQRCNGLILAEAQYYKITNTLPLTLREDRLPHCGVWTKGIDATFQLGINSSMCNCVRRRYGIYACVHHKNIVLHSNM